MAIRLTDDSERVGVGTVRERRPRHNHRIVEDATGCGLAGSCVLHTNVSPHNRQADLLGREVVLIPGSICQEIMRSCRPPSRSCGSANRGYALGESDLALLRG